MVAIFVAFMFVSLILVDLSIAEWNAWRIAQSQRQIRHADHAPVGVWQIPEGVSLSTAHTWSRADRSAQLKVGADPFLAYAIGPLQRIAMPKIGKRVVPGEALFAIEHNGRRLLVPSTVAGKVVAVNRLVQKHPTLLSSDPLRHGWVCRLSVAPSTVSPRLTRSGEHARQWLETEFTRLSEFLVPRIPIASPLGATSQDGGLPAPGCLSELPRSVWKEFAAEFLRWR